MAVVISAVTNVLAHAPGLVRYGSRPLRDIARDPGVADEVAARLRGFEAACGYAPNQAYIGNVAPEDLRAYPRPWFSAAGASARAEGPFGRIVAERELLALIAECDRARLVTLGTAPKGALPLFVDGEVAGGIVAGHEDDEALTANVLLENLACKATGVLAVRELLARGAVEPEGIDFVIAGSEEAVGDRYQRGGGNIAKAIGEGAGLARAAAHDVKSFCASTLYAVLTAGAYVETGLARRVVVVAGGSLAKLGMKYRAHVAKDMPILEDVLAGVALLVERAAEAGGPAGGDPIIRLDTASFHRIGDGSSQQAVLEALVGGPLGKAGLAMTDVDRYVTEMHNPEVTEPAGSGDVPAGNYRLIAGLAALKGVIARADMAQFIAERGMPGYAPTQGHIASAVCYLAHARAAMRAGTMRRALFMAKGSLFLGRLTELSDGVSVLVEAP